MLPSVRRWCGTKDDGGATGGGISEFFTLPGFQNLVRSTIGVNPGGKQGRGVPDVAGDADPTTGYLIRVDHREVSSAHRVVALCGRALIALIISTREFR